MSKDTSQSYSSRSVSRANADPAPSIVGGIGDISRRILIIVAGYVLSAMIAGGLLGRNLELGALDISLLSGIGIGATLAPIAAGVQTSQFRHWVICGSALLLNALSVAIEGAFFAPTLSPIVSIPLALTAYLLFQSLSTAGLFAWLFGQHADSTTPNLPRRRARYSWAWRISVSAFSYMQFYFIFKAVNYTLLTKPYYAAHVSGLVVPVLAS